MKCAILQPSYIPWRGYFHQIQKVDAFVFYDDVEYDRRGWRNRNRVKTPGGSQWLTIPVRARGSQIQHTPICDVQVDGLGWAAEHRKTLHQCYAKAPFYDRYAAMLDEWYGSPPINLADFTIATTMALSKALQIQDTTFIRSSTLAVEGRKTDRLLNILRLLAADHYITGPSARDYLEEEKFHANGVTLEYMTYAYLPYEQLYPPFDPFVTVLDLLFMTGPDAPRFIWDQSPAQA